ncbi:hypothetical protein MMC19_003101 [Ptychographa xylographoides]|nr:hypothetical protein [Ptychographa xylographoides]
MKQVELFRRQYLQLLEPEQLSFPARDVIRSPDVQADMFATIFQDEILPRSPPDRYKIRVLKKLVATIEAAFVDPEEDEILDDLVECLGQLMSRSQVSPTIAAQKKSFVTYTMPIIMEHAPVIITLEARALLASSGTTGLRTWEAALRLATFLSIEEGTQLVKNKNIIELGAGTGLLSILCTKYLGSKFVLATDGSGEVVDDMATNVFINGLEDSDKLETAGLAWGHALVDGVEQRFDGDRKLDIILGADLTYDQGSIMPLVSTIQDLFTMYPEAKAIISATVRNDETLRVFEQACYDQKFAVQLYSVSIPPQDQQIGFFHTSKVPIRIYGIRPEAGLDSAPRSFQENRVPSYEALCQRSVLKPLPSIG